ncbi:putative phosphoesterase [Paenibacillus shirakamiensis]|uniref:Phosphoesterase n=1 Tax=Paenibacillus shirakamiensis TaxID=1265935 RepID=A0ABS4JII1_9BACL|nr:metallophosphoesterase [Paenibacillus shirakamiensis]MBP2000926.1 putative phosphoesterase [Paenibacillus shirakamiensis]
MKLGIISDTHMPRSAKKLPSAIVQHFQGVDLILHLGDWVTLDVYHMLSQIAPVDGIAGNNDPEDIITKFGQRKILTLGSKKVGLVHGHLPFAGRSTEDKARLAFKQDQVDAILFGHSHQPLLKQVDGILLFNPGSAADKRREPKFSAGILEIYGDEMRAHHFFYDRKDD